MTAIETLTRSCYGEILTLSTETDLLGQARQLVKMAAAKKRIPASYDHTSWERINSRIGNMRTGSALHHEIYDISPNGKAVLVCCREIEGTRYGIKTVSKNYFLVKKHGRGVMAEVANKAVAAKAAKAAGNLLGYAIEVVTGKAKLKLKGTAQGVRTGYKALTLDESGSLVSCWDGSEWPLGKTRIEKATDDHSGGFYYYHTLEEVLQAAHENEIFGKARRHSNLMIVKVEVSGKEYQINHTGKRCATKMKPVEVVAAAI